MNKHPYQSMFPFDAQKHIKFVIENQSSGGWGEEIRKEGAIPSPLVTSQMILGLLPHLNVDYTKSLKTEIINTIKIAVKYLDSCFRDHGWSDHAGGERLIDATGAVVTALIDAIPLYEDVPETQELLTKVRSAVSYLQDEKNDDGGWGITRGSDSRMQFTYWALMALLSYRKSPLFKSEENKKRLLDCIGHGVKWLKDNFNSNKYLSFSIRINQKSNPVATAWGIELFNELDVPVDAEKVLEYLNKSQTAKGRWAIQDDAINFKSIPRRVYVLSDWPHIAVCLLILREPLSSNFFKDVMSHICDLQIERGGFKHRHDAPDIAIGWFTAQALKMIARFKTAIAVSEVHTAEQTPSPLQKLHSFSKAALMIGRFRPPHMGHCMGLKAILLGSEKEFSRPEEALKELVEIDKVFIGITSYGVNSDNPWSAGEVQDIWRQIIDNDNILRNKSNQIEIVLCPAEQNETNVANAIDGLTRKRESIIVVSGNERVLGQCDKNNLTYCKFARYEEGLTGSRIRDIIKSVNWKDIEKSAALLQELQLKLHPAAFKFMYEQGLFEKAQKIMKSK
jgi:nicotinamide mononucleotide adenylyltransferase